MFKCARHAVKEIIIGYVNSLLLNVCATLKLVHHVPHHGPHGVLQLEPL